MTPDDFDKAMEVGFRPRFPSVADWVAQRPETYQAWFDALRNVEFLDFMAVVRMMHFAELPRPQGFEDFPGAIRREALRMASIRAKDAQDASEKAKASTMRRPEKWDMSGIFRRMLETIKDGGDPSVHLPPILPEYEPRYSCLACHDRGTVRCWHPKTIQAFIECKAEDIEPKGDLLHYTCLYACGCRAGDRWHFRRGKDGADEVYLPRFNDHDHLPVIRSTTSNDDRQRLAAFVEKRQPVHAQQEAF